MSDMKLMPNIISFYGAKFGKAVHEHGWTYSQLSKACGKNKQYLKQAMTNGRINVNVYDQMCDILDLDPVEYVGVEEHTPGELPTGPIHLDTEGAVVLFQAIVTRAKEDYILAYRDLLSGKRKIRDGHMSLMVSTIEWELQSEWFKNHLIGAITANANAVDKMIAAWRREAIVLYDKQRIMKINRREHE